MWPRERERERENAVGRPWNVAFFMNTFPKCAGKSAFFPISKNMLLLRDKAVYPSLNASLASRRRRRRRKRSRASRARASSSDATTTSSETPFLCPSCGSKTVTLNCTKNTNKSNAKSLSCAKNGHARDYAKEGYVHLMTTGNSIVGDAKEMVNRDNITHNSNGAGKIASHLSHPVPAKYALNAHSRTESVYVFQLLLSSQASV